MKTYIKFLTSIFLKSFLNVLIIIFSLVVLINLLTEIEFFSDLDVNIFFPLHRLIRRLPILQKIFSRISPIITYYHVYPELSDNLQKEWSMLDTHDGLTDWYKHLRSQKQIKKLLEDINSESIDVWTGGNGVEARCKRPKKN